MRCVNVLGRQCNDTSDCATIPDVECVSDVDDVSRCMCMSGFRPSWYTTCISDDTAFRCSSGQMLTDNYECVEAINHPCYPTRYCGPDLDITCKSINGDETMAQCQCKDGLTWNSDLSQCSNEATGQECDYGHIFISATSTDCEPVIGHSCDGLSSKCGYMAGVECVMNHDVIDPIYGTYTYNCSCMPGWTQQEHFCIVDTTASCDHGQMWDADQGCVYVLGHQCNDTSDCTTIPDVECVLEVDDGISRCMCMSGWRPQGYTTCEPDYVPCGPGFIYTDHHVCVEAIHHPCYPTRYCGHDQAITCKSMNGDETMAQCQCKDGWTWNNHLSQCSNVTASQECDYGHIFISATSTDCEPVIGHSCDGSSSSCGYMAGVECVTNYEDTDINGLFTYNCSCMPGWTQHEDVCVLDTTAYCNYGQVWEADMGCMLVLGRQCNDTSNCNTIPDVECVSEGDDGISKCMCMSGWRPQGYTTCIPDDLYICGSGQMFTDNHDCVEAINHPCYPTRYCGPDPDITCKSINGDVTTAVCQCKDGLTWNNRLSQCSNVTASQECEYGHIFISATSTECEPVIGHMCDGLLSSCGYMAGVECVMNYDDPDNYGIATYKCSCMSGWTQHDQQCIVAPCTNGQMWEADTGCVHVLGHQCNDTSDCTTIPDVECVSEGDNGTSRCMCMSGWRPQGYTSCIPDDTAYSCGSGQMLTYNHGCIEVTNHPCYPTRYCGPDPDITCKSLNGDETTAVCQCKDGLTWNNRLSQCSNDTSSQECDYGNIFTSATSTNCEPVIGHMCDGLLSNCGYMAGVECVMNYDDPVNFGIFKCSCMPGWTEQDYKCILDTTASCNYGQMLEADKGCVYVLGRQCNDTSDCATIPDVECVSEGGDGTSRCKCMSGWRPQEYTTCMPDDQAHSCGSGQMFTDNYGCVEAINYSCYSTRYCGPDPTITCTSINGDETMAQCQCKDGLEWNSRLFQCSNATANQECDYGYIFISATSTECEPVIGHMCDGVLSSCGYMAGVECVMNYDDPDNYGIAAYKCSCMPGWTQQENQCIVDTSASCDYGRVWESDKGCVYVLGHTCNDTSDCTTVPDVECVSEGDDGISRCMCMPGWRPSYYTTCIHDDIAHMCGSGQMLTNHYDCVEVISHPCYPTRYCGPDPNITCKSMIGDETMAQCQCKDGWAWNNHLSQCSNETASQECDYGHIFISATSTECEPVIGHVCDGSLSSCSYMAGVECVINYDDPDNYGIFQCSCMPGWTQHDQHCTVNVTASCNMGQVWDDDKGCANVLGRPCNDTSDCDTIPDVECVSEGDDGISRCMCMSGWRPLGYTSCMPDDMISMCGPGQMFTDNYGCVEAIDHPCYPTQYCGPDRTITCKSMNGDETMAQCQCKDGWTWTNRLSQCSNETAIQECDYGHIFTSATSTECEPVIGHVCDGLLLNCSSMVGVECVMTYDDPDNYGIFKCSCMMGWTQQDNKCIVAPCSYGQVFDADRGCVYVLGRQCNDTSDCAGITSAECVSEGDDGTSWCKCMSGWRPQGYTTCIYEDYPCGTGYMYTDNHVCVEVINHPCYPTRYCGPDPAITCKSMNGDETMAQCQCKEGLTWNSHLFQCANETASQECDYGHIFTSATSTECEPVIGLSCDWSLSSCGYMAGLECAMNYTDPFTDHYNMHGECSCMSGWTQQDHKCILDNKSWCNYWQVWEADQGCVNVLGRQCNDTSDCAGITSAECVSEGDDGISRCMCMSGWRPQGYTDCMADDMSHSCGSGQMFSDNFGCVEAINHPCYPTRYCGNDPTITCKSLNGDEKTAVCQCKDGSTWNSRLSQCSNVTASQECDYGHIFISATSTDCEPVIGHVCDGLSSSCGYMAGVECVMTYDDPDNNVGILKCSCMPDWTQDENKCILNTTAWCNYGKVFKADKGCVNVLGRQCNDTSDCATMSDVECVSDVDDGISRCMCMSGWRPQGYTSCMSDDMGYSCGPGQMFVDYSGCVEVINHPCSTTRYCGTDPAISCKSINEDETTAQCQCKDGWTWNSHFSQCSNVTANQECDYGHIFPSATSTECEPVIGHVCDGSMSSCGNMVAGVECVINYDDPGFDPYTIHGECSCKTGWTQQEHKCIMNTTASCKYGQALKADQVCLDLLGRQCNDTSDCAGITSAECVSEGDNGTSWCKCMSGWRPQGYTDCVPDDYPCGSGYMYDDNYSCVKAINRSCYPTRYCGPYPDITCKSMNGDETMAQCQCKDGWAWNSNFSQCSNQTASEECDYGHIFISATSTECEPVIGHSCGSSMSSCGNMLGVECVMNYDDPGIDIYTIYGECSCKHGWTQQEDVCVLDTRESCNYGKVWDADQGCLYVLGHQCNDTSDCITIPDVECVSDVDDGISRCMCMSGWRPQGYTSCMPDDYSCGSGLMHVDNFVCVEAINHPCYPTRYCGPDPDITCKSMNGDETTAVCQCKDGLTWNNRLSQCSNETASQECEYGHIFTSANSTECEPVIGNGCDGSLSNCGYLAGVECVMNYDDPDSYTQFTYKCSCKPGWTQKDHKCIVTPCNDGQIWEADRGCVYVLGRQCNDTSDCATMSDVECASEGDGGISRCMCMSGWRPQGYFTCMPDETASFQCGSRRIQGVTGGCVEGAQISINHLCYPTRYCGPDPAITCKTINGDETMSQCQCKDGWTWNKDLSLCSNQTTSQECDYGYIFTSATSTECEPVIGQLCDGLMWGCDYIAGLECVWNYNDDYNMHGECSCKHGWTQQEDVCVLDTTTTCNYGMVWVADQGCVYVLGRQCNDTSDCATIPDVECVSDVDDGISRCMCMPGWRPSWYTTCIPDDTYYSCGSGQLLSDNHDCVEAMSRPCYPTRYCGPDQTITCKSMNGDETMAQCQCKDGLTWNNHLSQCYNETANQECDYGHIFVSATSTECEPVLEHSCDGLSSSCGNMAGVECVMNYDDPDNNGVFTYKCSCMPEWTQRERICVLDTLCNDGQVWVADQGCVYVLGHQCNATSDCATIPDVECVSDVDAGISRCMCMSGWRPQGYTTCIHDNTAFNCGSGQMDVDNHNCVEVIHHPCYPTRYCGADPDITCKSMNGDETMAQCQCKDGLTWNNHLYQCSNETANQECDYGQIFVSANSTECEPVIGHPCDWSLSSCGYMAGVECFMNYDDPYSIHGNCSCMYGWTEQEHKCIIDITKSCNYGHLWDADQGCVHVLGHQCNDTSDCAGIFSAECVSDVDDGISRCMCMPGWRPSYYTTCMLNDYPCGSGYMYDDHHVCVGVINHPCYPTRYCGPDPDITCKSTNGDETMAKCQCKDGWSWNNHLSQCSNVTANQECGYGHIFISNNSTDCEPVIGHSCDGLSSSCGYMAGVECVINHIDNDFTGIFTYKCSCMSGWTQQEDVCVLDTSALCNIGQVWVADKGCVYVFGRQCNDTSDCATISDVECVSDVDDGISRCMCMPGWRPQGYTECILDDPYICGLGQMFTDYYGCIEAINHPCYPTRYCGPDQTITCQSMNGDETMAQCQCKDGWMWNSRLFQCSNETSSQECDYGHIFISATSTDCEPVIGHVCDWSLSSCGYMAGVECLMNYNDPYGLHGNCSCMYGWTEQENKCIVATTTACNYGQVWEVDKGCVNVLGHQCNNTNDCTTIPDVECVSDVNDGISRCMCMSGLRPQGYTSCMSDDVPCAPGYMYTDHHDCVEVINHSCYPTRYCGNDPDITCKSMNGDETMAQCQCKDGWTWNSRLSQCSNETTSQECEYGHIFISATSTECEPVIGHVCDGSLSSCGYMAGVECVMNHDDPDNYGIFQCSCMIDWTQHEYTCIVDTAAWCNYGQEWEDDKGCVHVLGRQCNGTSDCAGITSAECVSEGDDSTSWCKCMSGWRPQGYTDCVPEDYPCGLGYIYDAHHMCVEVIGHSCDGFASSCGYMAGVECVMNYDDPDIYGIYQCSCMPGWTKQEHLCILDTLVFCNHGQVFDTDMGCVYVLGNQCNDQSDCASIPEVECVSEGDYGTTRCMCMPGLRPSWYTTCIPDPYSCGSGQMLTDNHDCVEAINHPCYPTRYCGPDPDITCKSMNGDETMAKCQCKDGWSWNNHLSQCYNETANQECDYGHIFVSATSTECEPVIGHGCDGSWSSCGYMPGVECIMNYDNFGPFTYNCSCMPGWIQHDYKCIIDTSVSCNHGQVWEADKGCVYVLGRQCNDTNDCTTIPDVECVSEGDDGSTRCMCMSGFRPSWYTSCMFDDSAFMCSSGQMLTDNYECVEVINHPCYPTRYCGPDPDITCKSMNEDETMAQCQCKDGLTWNSHLSQCYNETASQECDYGHIFISATSTECEPVIGHVCDDVLSSCSNMAGVECTVNDEDPYNYGQFKCWCMPGWTQQYDKCIVAPCDDGQVWEADKGCVHVLGRQCNDTSDCTTIPDVECVSEGDDSTSWCMCMSGWRPQGYTDCIPDDYSCDSGYMHVDQYGCVEVINYPCYPTRYCGIDPLITCKSMNEDETMAQCQCKEGLTWNSHLSQCSTECDYGHIFTSTTLTECEPVIGHVCDGLSSSCGYMAGVECVMTYDDPDNYDLHKCSCKPGWTQQDHICIIDTSTSCNHGQVWEAGDQGCVNVIGHSCGDTRYCGHMTDVTCSAVDTSGTDAQCQCNPGFVEYNNICVEELPPYITISDVTLSMSLGWTNEQPIPQTTCTFTVTDGYMYRVTWLMDNQVIASNDLTSKEAVTFVYSHESLTQTDVIVLDRQFMCSVSGWDRGFITMLQNDVYSPPFIPFEILTPSVDIPVSGTGTVSVKTNIALVCPDDTPCVYTFRIYDESENYACAENMIALVSTTTCGQQIDGIPISQSTSDSNATINMGLASRNNFNWYLKGNFTLTLAIDLKIPTATSIGSYWTGVFTSKINANVIEETVKWHYGYCYASNDPLFRTFDGVYSDSNADPVMSGAYIFYRNSQMKTEVQIATQLCYPQWSYAYCICGVAVRSGRTVYVKDYCRSSKKPFDGYLNDEGDLNWYRSSFIHDMFYTNYGTMIEVMSFPWMSSPKLYVNIYPSAADINNVDGLCGKFNGDPTDDFVHRDGTAEVTDPWLYYTTSTWYSWAEPTTFHLSWELSDDEDLTDPNTASWEYLDTVDTSISSVCVCPRDHTEAVCSQNEAHLCITGNSRRGTAVFWFRKKRSVSPEERQQNLKLKREKRNTDMLLRNKRQTDTTITEEDVVQKILDIVQILNTDCPGYEHTNDSNVNIDNTKALETLAMDQLRLPSVDLVSSFCVGMNAVVQTKVTNNNQLDDTYKADVIKSSCNCNNHGNCPDGDGVCVCDDGFNEDDCSIDLNKEVIVYAIEVANYDITLVGSINQLDAKALITELHVTVSLSSSTPWCKYLIQEAGIDGRFGAVFTLYEPGTIVTFIEVNCPKPREFGNRRRRRSTTTTIGIQYTLSVGNNGVDGTFGSTQTVIEIDDSCQTITTDAYNETVIVLQSGYCLISGLCYANGITSTANTCDKCDTTLDVFAWSTDTAIESCQSSISASSPVTTNEEGLQGYVIGLIVMGSILAVALVGITLFLTYKYGLKKTKQVVPAAPDGLYDTAPSSTPFKQGMDPLLAGPSQFERILAMPSIDFTGHEASRINPACPGPSGVTTVSVSEAPDTTCLQERFPKTATPEVTEKLKGYQNSLFR